MTPSNGPISSRIPALDGLRGLAIFLVVFHHYACFSHFKSSQNWLAYVIQTIFPLSWTGVDLFFVLSGFLIGGILMDYRDTENYFRTFYIRRICRIVPLYFLWLVLFATLPWLLSAGCHQGWYNWLFAKDFSKVPMWSYTVFLQNMFFSRTFLAGSYWVVVTWSLAVEEQFYLLLPAVIWFVPVRKLPYVLALLILFAPVFRLFLYLYHPEIYTFVLLPCRMDTLLTGVLCAYWIRHERSRLWLEKRQGRLYPVLGVLLAGAGYLTANANSPYSFEMVFLGYSWLALLYACLLLIVITEKKGVIISFMRLPLLRNLGIIAYGVYLMHLAINILMHGLILGREMYITNLLDVSVTVVALFTTLLLATLSWHFFEKPVIKWGHSFSYNDKNIQTIK
jgi:peptidoglycan/LPS O-acetylase OafA/YrhL